jgi:hypothetical protein
MPKTVKGKKLLKQLKVVAREAGRDDKLLDAYRIPVGIEIASDLRVLLENCLGPRSEQGN